MKVERFPTADGRIELWACVSDHQSTTDAGCRRQFLGYERAKILANAENHPLEAICWSYGSSMGNITVLDSTQFGNFPSDQGDDAVIACDLVEAGRMRNGAPRWWCRTHQAHWGRASDIASVLAGQELRCSNHMQLMSYIVDPPAFRVDEYTELGVWCSLPPAMTSAGTINSRRPKIHVHVRNEPNGEKLVDKDVAALALLYNDSSDLFGNSQFTRVHITPPAAFDFVVALERGTQMGCVNCKNCGYPHLDLGEFARKAHRKHLCSNCGRDNTWSQHPIVSTPLKPIHDHYSAADLFIDVTSTLNLDDYQDCHFALWASTPAVLWTARRPQERGIHVHLGKDGARLIDDTFGTVIYRGEKLDRAELMATMIAQTIR